MREFESGVCTSRIEEVGSCTGVGRQAREYALTYRIRISSRVTGPSGWKVFSEFALGALQNVTFLGSPAQFRKPRE